VSIRGGRCPTSDENVCSIVCIGVAAGVSNSPELGHCRGLEQLSVLEWVISGKRTVSPERIEKREKRKKRKEKKKEKRKQTLSQDASNFSMKKEA
jgi:hypothetical protein